MPTPLIRPVLLVAALLFSASAFAAPEISLTILAEKEITETTASGETVTRRVPATETVPGDVLMYTITYRNGGDEAARNVQLDNPIPDNTRYLDNSAWGDGSDILFSITGDSSFKKPGSLTYQVKTADGNTVEQRASPEQYDAIRWIVTEVPAGSEGRAGFSVTVE